MSQIQKLIRKIKLQTPAETNEAELLIECRMVLRKSARQTIIAGVILFVGILAMVAVDGPGIPMFAAAIIILLLHLAAERSQLFALLKRYSPEVYRRLKNYGDTPAYLK